MTAEVTLLIATSMHSQQPGHSATEFWVRELSGASAGREVINAGRVRLHEKVDDS